MKRYNEVATRFHQIGSRKIQEGEVVRTVSLSDREAQIMNELEESRDETQGGQKYKYVPLTPEEDEKWCAEQIAKRNGIPVGKKSVSASLDEKEIRSQLFAKAVELGLNLPKNTKTETLKAKVEEKEKEKENENK